MPTRKADATWTGGLKDGNGSFSGESSTISGSFSAGSRFGEDAGTNPEELIAAAHAACFSMALSAELEGAGFKPQQVQTTAACTVEKEGDGFSITTIKLTSRAKVPEIEEEKFRAIANGAKEGCPVSKALAGVDIQLDATLVS